jgi:hypothetical protein
MCEYTTDAVQQPGTNNPQRPAMPSAHLCLVIRHVAGALYIRPGGSADAPLKVWFWTCVPAQVP